MAADVLAEEASNDRRDAVGSRPAGSRPTAGDGGTVVTKPAGTAAAGLATRECARQTIGLVLQRGFSVDDAFERAVGSHAGLTDQRDRSLARAIALTAIRRIGQINVVLSGFLDRPLPARHADTQHILICGVAQLLFLGIPPHAAIDLAVRQTRAVNRGESMTKLVNAVLRRVAHDGAEIIANQPAGELNTPAWLASRWQKHYGNDIAAAIMTAHLNEPPLDLSVSRDAALWAARLNGVVLRTRSVRIQPKGRIEQMTGYGEGEWWVQDAAASLPVRMLGPVVGERVLDLCAAPGGKTAQLASLGADVTAVDSSVARTARLRDNLRRLKLAANVVEADVLQWQPETQFPFVLLDAPCSATGTIRRNPDIGYLKSEANIKDLASLQSRLLERAARFVAPGGAIVFCTCSLEPEEGSERIAAFLAKHPQFSLEPVSAEEMDGDPQWFTADGALRTLPCHEPLPERPSGGMDGFFAARMRRHG